MRNMKEYHLPEEIIELTGEQQEELRARLSDQEWRLDNLYYITNEDGMKVRFTMNSAQRFLYKHRWFLNLILKARQRGITTFISVFFLDSVLFSSNQSALIIAHTLDDARKIFDTKIKFAWDNLPDWLRAQFDVDTNTIYQLKFKTNGGSIAVSTSGRSGTFQFLHISEFGIICARWPEKAREIVTGTLQTIHMGNLTFIESTSKGRSGYFYDYCMQAMKDLKMGKELSMQDWKFFFFPWYEDEKYVLTGKVMINEEMAEYFQKLKDVHGITLTQEQKNWYVKKFEKLGDDMFSEFPSCVEENTLVSTPDGLVKIRDVEVDGKYILAKYDKGEKEVFKIKTILGYELECTNDHPILTSDGYKRLEELKIGDLICLGKNQFGNDIQKVIYHPNEFVKSEIIIDEDFARFLGYFMGDGSFCMNKTKSGTISIACDVQDIKTIEDVKFLMDKYLGGSHERRIGSNLGCLELRKASTKWLDSFLALGIIERNGDNRYKRRVHVPDFIKKSPEYIVKNFLSGLWESDGFVSRDGNHGGFFSKEEKFIKDIQLLLLSFGITSRLSIANKINGEGRTYVGRKLSLRKDEIIKFQKYIGFISERKVLRISKTKSKKTYNQLCIDFKDKISKIENIGYKRVFDITTSTKNFIANGIIVHNCPEEAFKASIEGAYFSKEMNKAYAEKRITVVPADKSLLVYTFWDIGVADETTIWFVQFFGNQIRIIDLYHNDGESIHHYASVLQQKAVTNNYIYGGHYGPHDLEVREIGNEDVKSRRQIAAGIGLNFTVVPRHSVDVGIDEVRVMFNMCWFDEKKCDRGISALQEYRKEWDDKNGGWKQKPLHNWASHYADAFRMLAMTYKTITGGGYDSTSVKGREKMNNNEGEGDFDKHAPTGGWY